MNGNELVKKIDYLLKLRNETRKSLADFCGINVQSFADWTRRGTLPNVIVAMKIAAYFNVTIEWLVYGKDYNEQSFLIKFDKAELLRKAEKYSDFLNGIEKLNDGNKELVDTIIKKMLESK
jgi:transcriptional regulator with XRE-family HTH domain